MASFFRRAVLVLLAAAVLAAIVLGMLPEPVEADLANVTRGTIRVTVDQDGKTRIRERYVVSAPLAGRLLRIDMDPGQRVDAGKTVLATIEPRDPDLLDARAIVEAEASVNAAEAKLRRMEPILEEAVAAQEFSEAELRRARESQMQNPQAISASSVEEKLMAYRKQSALVSSAQHAEEIARFELEQARAALIRSRPVEADSDSKGDRNGWNIVIRAPVDGRVLRVFQESSAVVAAGEDLLELGDPSDLEVEIDVLSRDAVKIRPGAPVMLEHWGGDETLVGRVRLVEPSAKTKISTLGVEEQRVDVIVDLDDPPTQLGDGFRVEARIIIVEAEDVLKIPASSLFRDGEQWAVFCVLNGVVQSRVVEVGLQNGLEAEVKVGLEEHDQVIVHPSDDIVDGVKVLPR